MLPHCPIECSFFTPLLTLVSSFEMSLAIRALDLVCNQSLALSKMTNNHLLLEIAIN